MPNSSESYQRSGLIEYNPDLIHPHPTVITVEHFVDLTSYVVRYHSQRSLQHLVIEVRIGLEEEPVVQAALELQQ
jgi:hypothetical protein